MPIKKIKASDYIFDIIVYTVLTLFALICIYPVLYVFSISISQPDEVMKMRVWLWPVGLSLKSYEYIARNEYLPLSYFNSVLYTIGYTVYAMILTIFGAYALSRRRLIGRNFFMFAIWFTMVFSGGMIPTFILFKNLGLYNTRWVMIIPGAVNQYNLIMMRTYMKSIPDSLEESAIIDGANDFTILFKIIVPASIPVIATISLFYIVAQWNDYFTALIYLNTRRLYPLQSILREILIAMTDKSTDPGKMSVHERRNFSPLGFKGAVIMVSVLPMMILYPFIQRYFVKGIMIGAIKG